MDIALLRKQFGIPGILTFDEHNGLVRAQVSTPHAEATVYMQGSHITAWKPSGSHPVIFLSRKSDFAPGKPIRGGVPIAFPWFSGDHKADRIDGHPGPPHGFARVQDWTLTAADHKGEDLHLTFTLGPTEMSRSLGFDKFRLTHEFMIGRTLRMQLTVANDAETPLTFEEAFHTYYSVADVHEAAVTGLEPTAYIDKVDNFKTKPAANAPIRFTGPTDRVYLDTEATCIIHDTGHGRKIRVQKENSKTTVVWNPWKGLPDLAEDDWHEMLCVETVNAAANSITLAPGESHTMAATITVEKA